MPTYTGISSETFRHPLDRQAEDALRSVPGFDIVAQSFLEYLYERPRQVYLLGNAIKASPRQYATLYGMLREGARDLDVSPQPDLFISQDPQANAYSLGHERPYIVINTELMDLLDEAELRTVIAHELGHIKCDHTILIQMAIWARGAASLLGELTLGVGRLINSGLLLAFYEWRRKAELSADRAALLVIDDVPIILQTMMKLAGGSRRYGNELSLDEFIRQADDYQELDRDGLNQLYKFLIYKGGNGAFLSHPFPVERLHYLQEWSASEEYQQIRQGHYPRGETKGSVDVSPNQREDEAESLRRQIEELQEQISQLKSKDQNS